MTTDVLPLSVTGPPGWLARNPNLNCPAGTTAPVVEWRPGWWSTVVVYPLAASTSWSRS